MTDPSETTILVIIGPGSMGTAIARRVGAGKHILVADLREENAQAASQTLLDAGFQVSTATVDITDPPSVRALAEKAAGMGAVTGLVHAAGASPSMSRPELVVRVDLYGTAVVLEAFGEVVAPGGAAVVIASQAGHRLPALTPEEDQALATTPAEELLGLPLLQSERLGDTLHAYELSNHGKSLRVQAEAVRWGLRRARVNAISPGIVMTPLSRAELSGPHGDGYRRMIEGCPAGRAGTADEVATVAALLMGPDGAFITGSDILMDGGATAAFFHGDLNLR
ncbi:SDR family oxidoreductase [Wenzhouxiangella sp. XN24]|uniref:SDR family oxidoreductase n=1 Tax=Wenzhouxiangella sp. XN24 TaxID=2713569 RepID=UPI0013EC3091|nr:SDR family oxidoreductase [Wenzhouxiangella sp. XN24]NGX17715.1 SDR family oxidoreductase [Wenzhouxiangella sp. XN24]